MQYHKQLVIKLDAAMLLILRYHIAGKKGHIIHKAGQPKLKIRAYDIARRLASNLKNSKARMYTRILYWSNGDNLIVSGTKGVLGLTWTLGVAIVAP